MNLTQFEDLGLAEPIIGAIKEKGYPKPTPIQAQTIPALCAGEDVLGIAQTGTGKTAAFVLPVLDRLARNKIDRQNGAAHALIVTPTRELASQIVDNIADYGQNIRPKVVLIVGGVKPFPQIRAMKKGADIIVATPGRLEDHLKSGKITLSQTKIVVLDEADQMLDLGFLPSIRRLMKSLPEQRTTAMFSATMPAPILALAKEFQNQPREVRVAPTSKPIELIDQKIIAVEKGDKFRLLVDHLGAPDVTRSVVFTRTKHGANKLSKRLYEAGFACDAIHGNKSQAQRNRALKSFASGEISILVATDIAARGIDIDDVSHVINYELPEVPEVYVHRIGRTARAGKSGMAIGFCSPAERSLLRNIEKLIGMTLLEGDDPIGSEPSNQNRGQNKRQARNQPGRNQGPKPAHKRRRQRTNAKRQDGPGSDNSTPGPNNKRRPRRTRPRKPR